MSEREPCSSRAKLSDPAEALARLCERVEPVGTESIDTFQAAGRVLAQGIILDRPSPACDVSAMDGYAVRVADIAGGGELAVGGEVKAGMSGVPLEPGRAVRIFTGAMVPSGAEAVIPRELLIERGETVSVPAGLGVKMGQYIRRAGENGMPGRQLAGPGCVVTPPLLAAAAACGLTDVCVRRRVGVAIIVTGGEVMSVAATPKPWQLRDCNGPALLGLLASACWIDAMPVVYVQDDRDAIAAAITSALTRCDALLITGGVSAGDYDFVPGVLDDLGVMTIFHRLAIRPGGPVLGAVDRAGRPILALPGNPVSAMVTARRLAGPVLRRCGGFTDIYGPAEIVDVEGTAAAPGTFTWFRLVGLTAPGRASPIGGMGSGDWVSAAGSDGFIEVPPGEAACGRRRLYRWAMS